VRQSIAYAARLMRAQIAAIPDGIYAFADSLDDARAFGPQIWAYRDQIECARARQSYWFASAWQAHRPHHL